MSTEGRQSPLPKDHMPDGATLLRQHYMDHGEEIQWWKVGRTMVICQIYADDEGYEAYTVVSATNPSTMSNEGMRAYLADLAQA